MLRYDCPSLADFNRVEVNIHGDDASSVLTVNLAKQPFKIVFDVPLPTVTVDTRDAVRTATATLDLNAQGEAILTATFDSPLPSTETIGPLFTFLYPSL